MVGPLKKFKEIIGSIKEVGWVDPDSDGSGYYYLKVQLRKGDVPDKPLESALARLLGRRVQVIQLD